VAGGQAADRTLLACREVLPAPLAQEVWSAVLKGADLTIFVESPAWATRVRYAAAELKERLGERLGTPLARIVVRVRPRP
jgi:predicted nucleic acid-binding Zn ribbon protein